MESHVYQRYPLSGISSEFPYACRFRTETAALLKSMSGAGLVMPVVLVEEAGKPAVVVAGHSRFLAARELGWKEIDARIIREPKNPADWFLFSVLSNWRQQWSDLDRCFSIDRALKFGMTERSVLEDLTPAMGLPSEKRYLDEAREVMTLHPDILNAVFEARLPFRGVKEFSVFSVSDQKTAASVLAGSLALTSNQLIKSVEWLRDLTRARGVALADLLSLPEVARITGNEVWNPRQKAEIFYQWLRAERFPEQVRREEAFVSAADRLAQEARRENSEFSVEAPPFFEAEGITLRARLKDAESLDRVLEVIQRKRNLFNSLFDIVL